MTELTRPHDSLADKKYAELCHYLQCLDSPLAIAFSGGVDSAFLLHTALKMRRAITRAVFFHSPFVHPSDIRTAHVLAAGFNALLTVLPWDPFHYSDIIKNSALRCYYCKSVMYRLLKRFARKEDIPLVMDGTQADDIRSGRPGLKAINELGIITPLAQFGLDKQDIRHLSYLQSLETWEMARQSCLAVRIKTGRPVTREELLLAEAVESMLHRKGVTGSRFRIGNGAAYIFIPDISRTEIESYLPNIRAVVKDAGFGSMQIAVGL